MIESIRAEISNKMNDVNTKLQKNLDSKIDVLKPLSELDKAFDLQDTIGEKELSVRDIEFIKEDSGWSDKIVESIHSMKEYTIYQEADLKEVQIGDQPCLTKQDINTDQIDEKGRTNSERLTKGLPPLDKNGSSIELHHIGQKSDSPLAELTIKEHRGIGNDAILHDKTKMSEIDRSSFGNERKKHWIERS
ncbi:MAG: HNH/ENDO VII family nuclease [Carnobacterium sp.]|nr:HNH/ENDO VII family nuclease [Carnobacterium sp.]